MAVDQIERARIVVEIATVQNAYNLANRKHEAVLDFCESRGIAFILFYLQRVGKLAGAEAKAMATREGVTPSLIALAWLFERSPAIIAIPGTSSVKHLDENVAASRVRLSPDDVVALDSLAIPEEPPTSGGNVSDQHLALRLERIRKAPELYVSIELQM